MDFPKAASNTAARPQLEGSLSEKTSLHQQGLHSVALADEAQPSTAQAVEVLAYDAATWAESEIVRQCMAHCIPALLASRYQTRNDLLYIINFLSGALLINEPLYFTCYVKWLRIALTTRGVELEYLLQSLELLRIFYERKLAPCHATAVGNILGLGAAVLAADADEPAKTSADDLTAWPQVTALTESVLAGDLPGARAITNDVAEQQRDYLNLAIHLIQPVLYRLGDLWHRNQLSVVASASALEICRILLVELFIWTAPRLSTINRSIVLVTVENDRHVIGLQLVAEAFLIAGWTVRYLGSGLSTSSLVQIVDGYRPDVLGLSVSLLQQLPTLKLACGRMRDAFGSQCPILLVGGRPTNEIEGIWQWTGADAWSRDPADAVRQLTSAP